ncbi:MAG: urea ABC transporter ATP-binding protein UrtD [Chloroflexaceae bacterium]|nr:urea ABC transporter ATP-binding protein UrtD [Chloroflexaceae bacterium]
MEKILEIENLIVSFDGFKALNQLNFHMEPGELRVIIGPNGAGKTTFLDVITGKVQPTEGRVLFKGRNLRKLKEHSIARLGIGRKFQTPRVYLNLTVRENLDLAYNRQKNVFSTLFNPTTASDRRSTASLLETIGLVPKADFPADLLSHGEKQRLEIGMLVAQSPDLLLVDEPVAGLTDEETENVGALLLALAESHSLIVIEHDMEFVRQIARRVTVLHQGSVLCEGSMDEIQNDPRVIEVYLGQKPSLDAHQLKLLRIVAAIAWSDGSLLPEEVEVIVQRLSRVFASNTANREHLQEELRDYLSQTLPIEDLVTELSDRERELVLKLSYEVIGSSVRNPEEAPVNEAEAAAYQRLVALLKLPPAVVQTLENAVRNEKLSID